MPKYLVTFIVHGPYYGAAAGIEVFGETCVNCHRDDAIDRAIDQYMEEYRHPPIYDEVEIEEVK